MSAGKVLLGVLAGVAVGATLGILLAPEKGSVTRRKISEKGDDYAEELEEKFNSFIDGVSKQFAAMKKEAVEKAEEGVEYVEEQVGHAMRTGEVK
jgi:gas vesicle protein